jgi:hypothetical protein
MLKNQQGFSLTVAVIVVLSLCGIGGAGYVVYKKQNDMKQDAKSINSFEECVDAGNPVAQSYPEQCHADGKSFANPDQTAPLPLNQ